MKNGFTLIELLVVVLIIGILAAVALPQYEKAVWKARSTPLLMWTQKLFESQEVYFLANGTYTQCLNDLDLGYENAFPTEIEKNGSCVTSVASGSGDMDMQMSTSCGIFKVMFVGGKYMKNGFGVYDGLVPANRRVGGLSGACANYGDSNGWKKLLSGMGYSNIVMGNYCCYQQVNQ